MTGMQQSIRNIQARRNATLQKLDGLVPRDAATSGVAVDTIVKNVGVNAAQNFDHTQARSRQILAAVQQKQACGDRDFVAHIAALQRAVEAGALHQGVACGAALESKYNMSEAQKTAVKEQVGICYAIIGDGCRLGALIGSL